MRRRLLRAISAVLVAVPVFFVGGSTPPSSAATVLLPDLGMAPVSTVTIDTTTMPGHKLLRYASRIVNVGAGPFEAEGTRTDTSQTQMTITQRVYDDAGSYTDVPITGTTMYWAGDGHNHWHITDMESGTLTRLSNGKVVGALAKHGFHIMDDFEYDSSLPGAPSTAFYTDANFPSAKDPSALQVTMGLDVGWGDIYRATTNYQWIDITGLPNGKYQLVIGADTSNWFDESNTTNNTTWATLRIRNNKVSVLAKGPGA